MRLVSNQDIPKPKGGTRHLAIFGKINNKSSDLSFSGNDNGVK